jgi:dUTP pyrophosphatase
MVKKGKKIEKKEKEVEKEIFLDVKKISKSSSLPEYMMNGDVGLDLRADEHVSLLPMDQKQVKTGLIIQIPEGHVGLIRDRAGIVSKMNVHTAAGTFNPDYRGEVSVVLVNFNETEVEIEKGMRIAQLVIIPVTKVKVRAVKTLSETERGSKGFGSTGIEEKIKEFKKLEKEIEKIRI